MNLKSTLLPLALAFSIFLNNAFAQENSYNNSATNTIAIHPITLIISTYPEAPKLLQLTYEKYNGQGSAFILVPEVRVGDMIESEMFLAKIALGVRKYLSKTEKGVYLQLLAGAAYVSTETYDEYYDDYYGDYYYSPEPTSENGLNFDLLGYVGVKGKWDNISLFLDLGLGWSCTTLKHSYVSSGLFTTEIVSLDMNFGLGFSF